MLERELEKIREEHASAVNCITQMFSVSSSCQVGPWARRSQSAQVIVVDVSTRNINNNSGLPEPFPYRSRALQGL